MADDIVQRYQSVERRKAELGKRRVQLETEKSGAEKQMAVVSQQIRTQLGIEPEALPQFLKDKEAELEAAVSEAERQLTAAGH